MLKITRFAGLVASLAAMALAGLPSASAVSDLTAQTVVWGKCDSSLLEASPDSGFDEASVQCTTVDVPLSYRDSDAGAHLTLQLMKSPATATGADYRGVLFTNPGGPGESDISYIQTAAIPKSIRKAYDLIAFDPRGVGASSPVKCSDELDLRSYFEWPLAPANARQARAQRAAELSFFSDCQSRNPYWWAISTQLVVKDMEFLRNLLTPDAPLNFVGHSYGTVLAARYITAYPEHAGRIVLDSPVTETADTVAGQVEQTKSMAAARTRLFKKCALDPKCFGKTVKDVENRLLWARDQAQAGKLQGYVADSVAPGFFKAGNGNSAYLIVRALALLSYFPIDEAYPYFKILYGRLAQRDYAGFEMLGLAMDGYEQDLTRNNSFDVLNIVNCLDTDQRDLRTDKQRAADRKKLEAADPFSTRFFKVFNYVAPTPKQPGCYWSWAAYASPLIPDPPAKPAPYANDSGLTPVVIGSKGDNVTPYPWAVKVAKTLKAKLLTYTGTGHAQLFGSSQCLNSSVSQYLLTGSTPVGLGICTG